MNMRIRNQFGQYIVEAQDGNGAWIDPCPTEASDFETLEEAQQYISEWDAECVEVVE